MIGQKNALAGPMPSIRASMIRPNPTITTALTRPKLTFFGRVDWRMPWLVAACSPGGCSTGDGSGIRIHSTA